MYPNYCINKVENTIKIFNKRRIEFLKLNLHEAIDWEKFHLMIISHHSSAIEGSSLTQIESQLLLDEGTTPKGKPLEHSLMEKDHYNALKYITKEAQKKRRITPEFIRSVSAMVMHGTGQQYNVAVGSFDSSKGEYRKVGVFTGSVSYPNFQKVENLVKEFCEDLTERIDKVKTPIEIYDLAFNAHFDLVTIHPFADGNGRVSRLILNYILAYHNETPAILHKEDRQEYIASMQASRKKEDPAIMRKFFYEQQIKHFNHQIEAHQSGTKGQFLTFMA